MTTRTGTGRSRDASPLDEPRVGNAAPGRTDGESDVAQASTASRRVTPAGITARRATGAAWTAARLVVLLVCAAPSCAVNAAGEPEVGAVRPRDGFAASLVEQGHTRSSTFARVMSELAASDVIVYVDVEQGVRAGPSGVLRFIGAAGGRRYVLVQIETGTPSWARALSRHQDLIAIIGHELQHALELAVAPEVVDHVGFAQMYAQIGTLVASNSFDTAAARRTGERVLEELQQRPAPETD